MALQDFSKYTRITVNPAIPKNEKDLICALLAGRLRNLFNGKLFCLNLAIGDLIKDASGFGLGDLTNGLKNLQNTLNDFKNEVGYDRILGSINSALGGIGTVFSLGGLCPSPITPPKIPDIMPQVNAALFGQGMNIINSLGRVLNPTMCFGGGPGGFGVNYNTMPGALQQLKTSLDRFKNDPAGLKRISKAFEASIKMQERRLKSEIKRLQTNLSDPFGIQLAKQRASALKSAHNRGADYAVTDSKGIKRQNVIKSLVPSDTLALLNVNDTTPILYKREAILNYCGDEVGIRLVPVSGDIEYAGWDTNPAANNIDRPFGHHALPEPSDSFYDFIIKEENNEVSVYKYNQDTKNLSKVTTVNLTRGNEYRFKLALINHSVTVNDTNNNEWNSGIEFSKQEATGLEIYETAKNLKQGELDWAVLIEKPTTPNNLKLSFSNGVIIPIIVSGVTSIPSDFKTYNLAEIVMKSLGFTKEVIQEGLPIPRRRWNDVYTFNVNTTITGSPLAYSKDLTYGTSIPDSGYSYKTNLDSEKVFKVKSKNNNLTISNNLYIDESSGTSINKFVLECGTNYVNIEFDQPIALSSDAKLPWKVTTSYKQYMLNSPNKYVDEMEFTLLNENTIRWYLTEERDGSSNIGKILLYYDIDISNINEPKLKNYKLKFRHTQNNSTVTYENNFIFKNNINVTELTASVPTLNYELISNVLVTINPVNVSNGLKPYNFSISPDLPVGLSMNPSTGQITGVPLLYYPQTSHTISISDDLENDPVLAFINLKVKNESFSSATSGGTGGGGGSGGGTVTGPFVPGGGYVSGWIPPAGLVNGRDYYYSSLWTDQPSYKDLRTVTPTKFVRQPLVSGNGVVYDWLVEGKTFQTGLVYEETLVRPNLVAFDALPYLQRRALMDQYSNTFTPPLQFLIGGSGPDEPNYTGSTQFKNFLISKGIKPATGSTFKSSHGDIYTWNGSAWSLTTPWTRT